MNTRISYFIAIFILILTSCSKEDSAELSSYPSASSSSGGSSGSGNQAGVITAGEWNDLNNWIFWENLISSNDFINMPQHWVFFNQNRVSVNIVNSDNEPVVDALVNLLRDSTIIFKARTDNHGNAELWIDLFHSNPRPDYSKFTIDINNGASVIDSVIPFNEGVNSIALSTPAADDRIEISFVVDATGSMSDELEFLKTELLDVISRIKNANPTSTIYTSSVFYRDEGDEYVTKVSNFSSDINMTMNFIRAQKADGGGDFPEAVHSALEQAVGVLQWSKTAKTRIMFLLLDAPPHHNNSVISSLQTSVLSASEKGIKIIPITASGIDKETEFLMRFMAMTTNGTYVFITDDSGVGNDHLEASVGQYEVEFLNDLMVRLINKYSE